jgi:protein-tyrosine phosphatase
MNVLMVCLGNICRSPLAEGILKSKIKENNLHWTVDSAGTGGYHIDALPDQRSIQIAKAYGIDISDQRARKVRSVDFEEFDLIFAMDAYNYQDLKKQAHDIEQDKIKMILDGNKSVPDPYYGGDDGFKNVFLMLDEACDNIIKTYNK